MKQFQVPQFIDVEDTIIGPFTLKQFLYLLGGGAIIVIARALFIPVFFYLIAIVVLLFSLALAFYKVDGIPFPKIVLAAFGYFSRPHLYLWKQEEPEKKKPSDEELTSQTSLIIPKASESKLADLAWSLDIKENIEERKP